MIATTTPFLNVLLNTKIEENASINCLNKDETMFYNQIKTSLNALVKQPKQETINSILAFSKSM
ncbi:MAG: hypothetical protein EAZ15_06910 [Sphingobacteriales bacterium]|nr:MAG: hypothetical protein EAZ15_06910 [Sphingobacteriales bacterium]